MKILFLTWQFPNFACTFILNEIVELLCQGHDVSIGSLFRPDLDIIHDDVIQFDLVARTYYLEDYARPNDHMPDEVAKFLSPNLQHLENSFLSFAKTIVDLRIAFIHADFANLGATAAMILSRLTGIPYSFETHSLDLFVKFSFAQEKLKTAAFLTTESEYNQKYLNSVLNSPLGKVYITRLCPNYRVMNDLPDCDKKPLQLCSVCRLTAIKGIDFAIRAINKLRRDFNFQYIIVGKGDDEESLRNLVEEFNLQSVVHFYGPLSNTHALSIVKQSSVFLLPSVIDSSGDRDGTPTAIAEAMYLETPVISSNISGIPEMVKHNETGILTEPGDEDAIEKGLRTLLGDHERRGKYAKAGKEHISVLFNPQYNVERLVSLFEKYK
jgi:colanic acid/amylovoran biosynthesis glycosyltransferase